MKDDYGFVCFPKGPKGTGKYPSLNSSNMWVIPSYYDDATLAKIAKIVDFYTEDVPEYDDPEAWKEGYWSSFRDERAVNETLQLMMDNATESIQTLVPDLNVAEMSWSICGGADPMETYETLFDRLSAGYPNAFSLQNRCATPQTIGRNAHAMDCSACIFPKVLRLAQTPH